MSCLDYTDPMAAAQLTPADWQQIEGDTLEVVRRLLDYPNVMVLPVDMIFDLKMLADRLEQAQAEEPVLAN